MSSSSSPAHSCPALVGVVMGSKSDWDTMQHSVAILESFGIAHEVRVVSAHRTPDLLMDYAAKAAERGLEVIIAGAGGAAPPRTTTWSSRPIPWKTGAWR